jgi:hypothetical protein
MTLTDKTLFIAAPVVSVYTPGAEPQVDLFVNRV